MERVFVLDITVGTADISQKDRLVPTFLARFMNTPMVTDDRWRGAPRAAARAAGTALVSGGLYAAHWLEGRVRPVPPPRLQRYVALWAGAEARILGVDLVLLPPPDGMDLRAAGPRLVVSNHRSGLDIVIMLRLFGGSILARGDMAGWPLLGPLVRAAGTLFVDRDDAESRAAAIRRVRERLRAGQTVIVFPEGTTFPGDEVRPFHPGAFLALARARGEVRPVGLAYADPAAGFGDETFPAHLSRVLRLPGARVAVAVGPGIPAQGRGTEVLRDEAHAAVQAQVLRARAALCG